MRDKERKEKGRRQEAGDLKRGREGETEEKGEKKQRKRDSSSREK